MHPLDHALAGPETTSMVEPTISPETRHTGELHLSQLHFRDADEDEGRVGDVVTDAELSISGIGDSDVTDGTGMVHQTSTPLRSPESDIIVPVFQVDDIGGLDKEAQV